MRIIRGTAGGIILKVPKGLDVRPTPDLVKQALFNCLGDRVAGTRVLELFAGTGALGLECLSCGARHVVSIEKSGRHARVIRENLARARLPAAAFELRVDDAFAMIDRLAAQKVTFDLILADPPFGEKNVGRRSTSLSQKLLDHELLLDILAADGLFILGHTKRDTLTPNPSWREVRVLKHGDSMLRFLEKASLQSRDVNQSP